MKNSYFIILAKEFFNTLNNKQKRIHVNQTEMQLSTKKNYHLLEWRLRRNETLFFK